MVRGSWIIAAVVAVLPQRAGAADPVSPTCVPDFRVIIDGSLPPGTDEEIAAELVRLRQRLDRDLGMPDRPVIVDHISINQPTTMRQIAVARQDVSEHDDLNACLDRLRRSYVRAYLTQRWPQRPDWLEEALENYYAGGCDEPLTAETYQQLRARYERTRSPRWRYIRELDSLPSLLSREYADAVIRLRPTWSR